MKKTKIIPKCNICGAKDNLQRIGILLRKEKANIYIQACPKCSRLSQRALLAKMRAKYLGGN
jgi:formate dehydrogenase maturation protein FdhE